MTQPPLFMQLRYFGRNRTSVIFHSTSSPNNSFRVTNRVFSSCGSQLHPAFISYVTWWNINSLELVSHQITMKNADLFWQLCSIFRTQPKHRLRLQFQWGKKEMPTHSTIAVFHHPSKCRLLGVKLPSGAFRKPFMVAYEQVPLHHQLCGLCLPSGFNLTPKQSGKCKSWW